MRHGRLAMTVVGVVLAGAAPAIGAPTRTTVVLNAPGSPRATALSSSFVQVDWTDTNTKETGYAVERAMSSSGPFTQVAKTRRNITSIGDGSIAANTTYFYRVRATGRRNVFSPYSTAVSATTPKSGDRWPPSVPKDLAARVFACDQVSLRWTASFDGSGVKGYNIRRGTTTQFVAGQNFFTDATPGGTALSYTVSAIDTFDNESAPSAVVTATTTPCPGPRSWAKHFGGADDEVVTGSAVDASGNVYVVGRFTGNTNLGGVTLQSAGSHDVFVVKYANDGTHQWSKRFGSTTADSAYAVAIDRAGNVVVVGGFQGTVNFGGGSLVSTGGSSDIFVLKLSAAGAFVSAVRYGGPGLDQATAVAVDRDNNLVLGGTYYDGTSLGGPVLHEYNFDSFVAKYSPTGQYLWARQLHSNYCNGIKGVGTDAAGNIAATGYFCARADFGHGPEPSTEISTADAFVEMLTPGGQVRWAHHFGDTSDDSSNALAIDHAGAVIIAGHIQGFVDFTGGGTHPRPLGYTFIAKYSTSGALQWSRTGGGYNHEDEAAAVAVGADDSIVMAGTMLAGVNWPASYGGPSFTGAAIDDNRDAFVARYTSAGVHVWSHAFGGPSTDDAKAVAIDSAGHAFVAGSYWTSVHFAGSTLPTNGRLDAFLTRIDS